MKKCHLFFAVLTALAPALHSAAPDTPTLTASLTPSCTRTISPTPDPASCGVFGDLEVGPTAYGSGLLCYYVLSQTFTLPYNGVIQALNLYVDSTAGGSFSMGIYQGGSLLMQTPYQASVTGWNSIPVSSFYLGAGDYQLAVKVSCDMNIRIRLGPSMCLAVSGGSSMPATLSGVCGSTGAALYADYCPSGSPTFTPTATPTGTRTVTKTITSTRTATPTFSPSLTPTTTVTPIPGCGPDSSLGFSDISSGLFLYSPGYFRASAYSLGVWAESRSFLFYCISQSSGGRVNLGLYQQLSPSAAATLLYETGQIQPDLGWNSVPIPAQTLAPATYWIGVVTNGNSYLTGDASTSNTASIQLVPSGMSPLPVTGVTTTSQAARFAILLNYCEIPAPSPTATISATPPVGTATPVQSATASPSASPSSPATASPSRTVSATATATRTRTATPSPSPIASATPTASPPGTLTASPTQTASFTASPSATISPTFSVSPTVSQTWTVSPSPTLAADPGGTLKVLEQRLMPQPMGPKAGRLFFRLEGGAAELTWRIYSPAAVLVEERHLVGPYGAGWSNVPVELSQLAAGTYFSVLQAQRGAEKSAGNKKVFYLMR